MNYNTEKTAKILGKSRQRIRAMLKQDQHSDCTKKHFPNAEKIGRDWVIPYKDVLKKLTGKKLRK
jgi:hypothetical protein